MRKTLAVLTAIGLLAGALAVVPAASAQETTVVHVTYEWAQTGITVEDSSEYFGVCPPATNDGWCDIGGTEFFCNPPEGSIDDAREPGCDFTLAQVSIVDDLWGAGVVVGIVATDVNGNHITGEEDEGEVSETFCGDSSSFDIPDLEGPNYASIAIFLPGPDAQATNCDPAAAPTGATTGGILDPAGGIFVTLS